MALVIFCQKRLIIRLDNLPRLAARRGQQIFPILLHCRKYAEIHIARGNACAIIRRQILPINQQELKSIRIQTAFQIALLHQHVRGYVAAIIIAVKLAVFAHPAAFRAVDLIILLCRRGNRRQSVIHLGCLPKGLILRAFLAVRLFVLFFIILGLFSRLLFIGFIRFSTRHDNLRCAALSIRSICIGGKGTAQVAAAHQEHAKSQKQAKDTFIPHGNHPLYP